jgi:hypothetical protein
MSYDYLPLNDHSMSINLGSVILGGRVLQGEGGTPGSCSVLRPVAAAMLAFSNMTIAGLAGTRAEWPVALAVRVCPGMGISSSTKMSSRDKVGRLTTSVRRNGGVVEVQVGGCAEGRLENASAACTADLPLAQFTGGCDVMAAESTGGNEEARLELVVVGY